MTEPRDQSQRGFDAGGPPEGAHRFWEQYASARSQRRTRNGEGEHESSGPPGEAAPGDHECLDWCPICRGAEVVRATAPPEIREQWQTLQRDGLIMLRSLIDAYLGRLEGHREDGPEVQDIRID